MAAQHRRIVALFEQAEGRIGEVYVRERLRLDLRQATSDFGSAQAKGKALEDLLGKLVEADGELALIERNYRTETEEINLVVRYLGKSPFWLAMGSPTIVVEAKNWSRAVGTSEIRDFSGKIRDRGLLCKVGVFVAINGFSDPAKEIVRRRIVDETVIFLVTGDNIQNLIDKGLSLVQWIEEEGVKIAY